MAKIFNISGACRPDRHYMVNLGIRLEKIKAMIDDGQYFTINKARQYGKTTTLRALSDYLKQDYIIVNLDFQNESSFVNALTKEIIRRMRYREGMPDKTKARLLELAAHKDSKSNIAEIFDCFSEWCELSEKPVVLIIDEVDTAANNQVFLDFLAQLRSQECLKSMKQTAIPEWILGKCRS